MGAFAANRVIDLSRRLDRRVVALLWGGALLLLTTVYVFRERQGLTRLAAIGRDADPWWVLGTLMMHLTILGIVVATYRMLLRRLGHPIGWREMARLQLQREVVATVAPLSGPASLYVYLRGLKRRAVTADDALLAAGMRGAADTIAFVALLGLVLALHPPPGFVLVALVPVVGAIGGVIVLAVRWQGIRRWGRPLLPVRVQHFLIQSRSHAITPRDLLFPFGLAVLGRIAGAVMLYAAVRALGEHPSLLSPVVAVVIGNLSRRLAPVFQGLGVVEASVAAALERQGISDAAAIGAALLCRVGNLWLPLSLALVAQTGDYLRSAGKLPSRRRRAPDGLSA